MRRAGLLTARMVAGEVRRIIPARAGFTEQRGAAVGPDPDHPRSRGVYGGAPFRGPRPGGIIPARAGFTAAHGRVGDPGRDHPRSRGVYVDHGGGLMVCGGSSPLARGLPARDRATPAHLRIIPARAGFTRELGAVVEHLRDHPRSRGVYDPVGALRGGGYGSSPLARGLPAHGPAGLAGLRIIPARAGFTGRITRRSLRCRDHPRSRGVYLILRIRARVRRGSSPLARGLHAIVPPCHTCARIIPARAGFTRPLTR